MFKLQQIGTVSEYLTEFERLANRTLGLPPSCMLSCFVSGLIPKLRRKVQALRPLSLPQATELARLQEDKMMDCRRGNRSSSFPLNPNFSHKTPSQSLTAPPLRSHSNDSRRKKWRSIVSKGSVTSAMGNGRMVPDASHTYTFSSRVTTSTLHQVRQPSSHILGPRTTPLCLHKLT